MSPESNPESLYDSEPVASIASPVEQYREIVSETDTEAVAAISKAVNLIRQEAKDEVAEEFRASVEAIRGYLKAAAAENRGYIPISVADAILNDVLAAKK